MAVLDTEARVAEVAVAGLLALGLYALLVWVERRGWRIELLTVTLGLLLFEGVLWDQNYVPVGLFHPRFAGQNFRLYDVLLPLALLARLRVRGLPKRVSATGVAIGLFCTWYSFAAVLGVLHGYGFSNVLYEFKLVIYLGGGYLLAAGTTAEELLGPHGPRRLVRPFAVLTLILLALLATRNGISISIPTLSVTDLRGIEPDGTTLVASLGLIALLVELSQPKRSRSMVAACLVLLIAPFGLSQRAALVALAASVVVALVAWLWPVRHRHRVRLTPTEVALSTSTVLASLVSFVLLSGKSPLRLRSFPLGSTIASAFASTEKSQSAGDRVAEIAGSVPTILQHPFIGSGLAVTISYLSRSAGEVTTSSPDNIYLCLILRAGLLGLALFVAAVVTGLVPAVRVFRQHPDPRVAALAWGCLAAVIGILARGAVEGIFEKYRIAVMLGIVLGMLQTTDRSLMALVAPTHDARTLSVSASPK